MLPLPEPISGGSIELLRPLLNVTEESWPLVVGWLVGALSPTGPYPILLLNAEQGAAKSTTARLLQFCFSYDPEGRTYAFNLARVVGSVMLISIMFFAIFLFFSTRRHRQKEV